jgi:phosphoglycerate dehydrogenase-like enzyme
VAVDRPWRLLALPPLDADLLSSLLGGPQVEVVVPERRDAAAVRRAVADADIVVGDWSGEISLDADVVSGAGRLAFVQQPSAGIDTVDGAALREVGVPLSNIGPANAVSVAEWCVGASFAVLRWLAYADAEVRAGRWPQLELSQRGGGELAGRRVGIVGMGHIGVACAQRYQALGADVAFWSRHRRPPEEAGGARWLPFEELLGHAQLLVVVVALTPETRGLIGEAELSRLPAGAFVVDAARGGIVDESALLAAVRSGALAGAALDVFAREPLPADSPLLAEDRILLSPHAAGSSPQAQGRLIDAVVGNIARAVSGDPVLFVVNDADPVVRRRDG